MIKTMLHGSFTNEKMANNTSLNFGCYIVLNTDIVKTVLLENQFYILLLKMNSV